MKFQDGTAKLLALTTHGFRGSRRKYFLPALLGLLTTAMFFLTNISSPAITDRLGDLLFDAYQRASPREYNPDMPVRIIDIDDESLKRIGQWPWPRTTLAKMNDKLADAGAAVIAYDVVFSEPDRTSPENIIAVLQNNPNAKGQLEEIKTLKSHDEILAESFASTQVVGGFFLVNETGAPLPATRRGFAFSGELPDKFVLSTHGVLASLPSLEAGMVGEGHVAFNPGVDGIVRKAPLMARVGDQYMPSLSVEVLRVATQAGSIKVKTTKGHEEIGSTADGPAGVAFMVVGDYTIPTTKSGDLRVYFTKPAPEQRYIPAWKILSDDVPVSDWQDRVEGQLIFVGTGAIGLKDLRSTPLNPVEPGVLIHAQAVEQILEQKFLERPYWAPVVEMTVLITAGLLLSLLLPLLTAARGAILSLSLALGVGFGAWHAFTSQLLLLNPISPLVAMLTIYLAMTLTSFYLTESERSRIRNAFSMYLSPTMVSKVSEDPGLLKLGGEERNMTVLFLDIRSFSKISESMQPQEITTFLNIFLTPMTNILQEGKATIDKYIGDAIVAFWNAPLDDDVHEENAARAVLDMLSKLDTLNTKMENQDEINWPQNVKVGIGLNTGICCVGNLGSDQRFSYSMIGDAANLASRIEGLTKQYGVASLIGNETAQALPEFALLEADLIKVIGRQTPERIHILVGDEKIAADADFQHLRAKHDELLAHYREQDWSHAEMLCDVLTPLADKFGCGGYYPILKARISEYAQMSPETDWDGVYIATQK